MRAVPSTPREPRLKPGSTDLLPAPRARKARGSWAHPSRRSWARSWRGSVGTAAIPRRAQSGLRVRERVSGSVWGRAPSPVRSRATCARDEAWSLSMAVANRWNSAAGGSRRSVGTAFRPCRTGETDTSPRSGRQFFFERTTTARASPPASRTGDHSVGDRARDRP